jgi:hypothetical protein
MRPILLKGNTGPGKWFRGMIASSLIVIGGCSSPGGSSSGPGSSTSCNLSFGTDSSEAICRWYWGNSFPQCDGKMRDEIRSRNQQLSPREQCGVPNHLRSAPPAIPAPPAPSPLACTLNFTGDSPQQICRWYWENSFTQCDQRMRDEFTRRGLKISPSQECGQSASSQALAPPARPRASQCTRDFRFVAPQAICRTYWKNEAVECVSDLLLELSRRGLMISPESECGKRADGQSASTTQTAEPPCTLGSIREFAGQPTSRLCQIAHGTTSCRQLARVALAGAGLGVGQVAAICGRAEAGQCQALVSRLSSASNPVAAACTVRGDRTSVEGVRCRAAINGLLLREGKGSGGSGGRCGDPLTSRDLQVMSQGG